MSVADLAQRKAYDHRRDFSCWLSESIRESHPSFCFERILCFEPARKDANPANVVEDIFRALAPFVVAEPEITSIAMPLLACGDQGASVELILHPLVRAAVRWMRTSPLQTVRIYEQSSDKARRMRAVFTEVKADIQRSQTFAEKDFDVFLSYSHKNDRAADAIVHTLRSLEPTVRVFRDSERLRTGGDYHAQLDRALRRSHRMLAVYSPEYVGSPACQDEFTTAFNISGRGQPDILFPLRVHDVSLVDRRMLDRHYEDCVELDMSKIRDACSKLVAQLF
jgi:hypothetical protein